MTTQPDPNDPTTDLLLDESASEEITKQLEAQNPKNPNADVIHKFPKGRW